MTDADEPGEWVPVSVPVARGVRVVVLEPVPTPLRDRVDVDVSVGLRAARDLVAVVVIV